MAEHLQAQHSAIKMLHNRIALILQYIQAVEKGSLPDLNYYLFMYIYLSLTFSIPHHFMNYCLQKSGVSK